MGTKMCEQSEHENFSWHNCNRYSTTNIVLFNYFLRISKLLHNYFTNFLKFRWFHIGLYGSQNYSTIPNPVPCVLTIRCTKGVRTVRCTKAGSDCSVHADNRRHQQG